MASRRRVRTASGATAVQIVEYVGGNEYVVVAHVGSAHTAADLAVLWVRAGEMLHHEGQGVLDLGDDYLIPRVELVSPAAERALFAMPAAPKLSRSAVAAGMRLISTGSRDLYNALACVYDDLGYNELMDPVFWDLVISWVVEQRSLRKAHRAIEALGMPTVSESTVRRTMKRVVAENYRDRIADLNFEHVMARGDVSLCLYDVTSVPTHCEEERDVQKVGFSKSRSIDPQIVVGLLVDRRGFPLEIDAFAGNTAEKNTILTIIEQFRSRHGLDDMVVVADAGMLSAKVLTSLDDLGFWFIVGARNTKGPYDLESHFRWNGEVIKDGTVIDTVTAKIGTKPVDNDPMVRCEPVWDPKTMPSSWRAVWVYSRKRFVRDSRNLTKQEDKARAVVAGQKAARSPRFVTTKGSALVVNENALAKARKMAGLKGFLTNMPASVMPAAEIVSSYHDLWEVERSFRMFKSDLATAPMHVWSERSIQAHITRSFAALAIAREVQARTGLAIANVIDQLEQLRHATIQINGNTAVVRPDISPAQQAILDAIYQHDTKPTT